MWRKRIDDELLFDKGTVARVKDRQWHASQRIKCLKDGRVSLVLRIADTRGLLGWILSFGAGVRVIRPDSLREKVREEAEKILRDL